MINIYIDHNIWDYLFENNIDIRDVFTKENFNICIAKHGRYEIDQLSKKPNKNNLRYFIESTMTHDDVLQQDTFGFYESSHPDNEQRSSGFGVGGFTSSSTNRMRKLLDELYPEKPKRKETLILTPNEADKELGAISVHDYVLTQDIKPGPLKTAKENGGKIIYIQDFLNNCTPREALKKIATSIM